MQYGLTKCILPRGGHFILVHIPRSLPCPRSRQGHHHGSPNERDVVPLSVPVQQLPEAADLPSSTTELLLGLQPRLRLPALQGGRRPFREAVVGLLHPRAIPALQPVAVTIRELSVPPPCAPRGRRSASPLLQIDLPVPDDRALEIIPSLR